MILILGLLVAALNSEPQLLGVDPATVRRKVRELPYAAEVYRDLRTQADELRTRGVHIPLPPEELSGWGHNFVCPVCAASLSFDAASPRRHRCDACGKDFESVDLDQAWVALFNLYQIRGAQAASIVAVVEHDSAAARQALDVLLGYAAAYPAAREHGRWMGKGRIQAQSLDEAAWMIVAARVYATLRDFGYLDVREQRLVVDSMFVPALSLLERQTGTIHNSQVWNAAAIYSLAVESGREMDQLYAEQEISQNLIRGVLPGGSWYEGSPPYHFYALEAFCQYALVARAKGRALARPLVMERMFRAPLATLQPDTAFACFNDGSATSPLAGQAAIYEMGEFLFGGNADVLGAIYGGGAPRASLEALLFGPDTVGRATIAHPRTEVVDGVGVVRRGGMVGMIKATSAGGGHDHLDKPGLYLYLDTAGLKAADLGTPMYGDPLHQEFFRKTVAHNTVLVDDQDQALADAKIVRTEDCEAFSSMTAVAERAYAGVNITRTCVFGDGWVIDWTRATSDQRHGYEWLFHANGTLNMPGTFSSRQFVRNPHVTGQTVMTVDGRGGLECAWQSREDDGTAVRVQLWPSGPEAWVGMAQMPALPGGTHVDLLAVGCGGDTLDVVACFAAKQEGRRAATAKIKRRSPDAVEIDVREKERTLHLILAKDGGCVSK